MHETPQNRAPGVHGDPGDAIAQGGDPERGTWTHAYNQGRDEGYAIGRASGWQQGFDEGKIQGRRLALLDAEDGRAPVAPQWFVCGLALGVVVTTLVCWSVMLG